LIHEYFGPGDKLVPTTSDSSAIFARGYITARHGKVLLLINKTLLEQSVNVPNISGGKIEVVDLTTNFNPPAVSTLLSNSVVLEAFAIAVITYP